MRYNQLFYAVSLRQLLSKLRYFLGKSVSFLLIGLLISACSSVPKKADGIDNACDILKTDKSWEEAFDDTYKKYGVPPHVIMAIIHQESRFVHDARPPKKTFLGIPTVRPSTAYGFAQALDQTWEWYQDKGDNSSGDRDHLPDAVDFIGWYLNETHRRTGVSKWDTENQYLAYHDGTGGYIKGTHLKKAWLLAVAKKVARRSVMYRQQLASCYTYPPL